MEIEKDEKVKDLIKEKSKNEEEERMEELLRILSTHDWDGHLKLIMLEFEANRLRREYEALEAIQKYSRKIATLKEQMESEDFQENFEVETESENIQDVEIFDTPNSFDDECHANLDTTSSEIKIEADISSGSKTGNVEG